MATSTIKREHPNTGTFTCNVSVGGTVLINDDRTVSSTITDGSVPSKTENALYIADAFSQNDNAQITFALSGTNKRKLICNTNVAQILEVKWYEY